MPLPLLILIILLCVFVGLPVLFFAFVMLCSVFVDRSKESDHNSRFVRFLLNTSSGALCFFCNIRVHVTGMEILPKDSRFLLASNHISKFDPMLTWYILRKYDIAYISKPENFKVPFYGALIRRCCFMPIDRDNPKSAIRTINRAASLMAADEVSVGVYPEGKRGSGDALEPFHDGVFRAAQKANVPVVASSVSGTTGIAAHPFIRRKDVYIDFAGVMPKEEVTSLRTADIGAWCRGLIEQSLSKHKGDR